MPRAGSVSLRSESWNPGPTLPRKRRLRMGLRLAAALWGHREARTRPALVAGHLPHFEARVEILRDARGLAHVYAEGERDLYAVLGFLQAADRFFQIDLLRHIGAARLSEWIGNPRAPKQGDELFAGRRVSDLDAFLRPFDFEAASHRDLAAMPGPARACVEAFAEGVNAALRAMDGVYPTEYLVVGRVRPWHPADCLLTARASGLAVTLINLENELTFDAVRSHAGDPLARRLYPEAPWQNAPQLTRHAVGSLPEPPVHLPSVGSNNWAVSGERSLSGAPILANDPHVPLLPLPTYWYPVHLECPEYRVQGGCFPGYPAFGFGHNGHFAWGCTTGFRDSWDLFRVHRLAEDAARYRTPTGSQEIESHRDPRRVRLGRRLELRWDSCEHGILYPGWTHGEGVDLAVRYVPSDAGRYITGYLALAAARSLEQQRSALRDMHEGPFDFNHVWAHRDGAFGWQLFGKLPQRQHDGLFVRDAHDPDAQWRGFVPFDAMPRLENPAIGYVATANSYTDPSQSDPVATRVHFEPRHRQDQIEAQLAANPIHRPEDSTDLQSDVRAKYAPALRDALLALLLPLRGDGSREDRALTLLKGWDGSFDAESSAASVFYFTRRALADRCFLAVLGPRVGKRFANGRRALPRLERLLLDPADPLRGDIESAAGQSLASLAGEALRAALDRLQARCGEDPSAWHWGDIQRVRLGTLLAELPGIGRRLRALEAAFPGDDYTVNPSRSLEADGRLRAFVAASSRFVCDLARPDEAWFAHSSGPSGDPGSAWHANLSVPWSRFEYFRAALGPADRVPDVVERVVVTAPAGGMRTE
ncbi:MAG: penicillin acylase family protein [Myxococcota bacterium]|nr:penicillin acylase family protein [Myxococcota bacterium]